MVASFLAVTMIAANLAAAVTASAYTAEHPSVPEGVSKPEWGRMEWKGDGGYLPLDFSALFDFPVRDTFIQYIPASVQRGGDYYYLVGTTGYPTWFSNTEGVRMWRSRDMKNWEDLGVVWNIRDSKWALGDNDEVACWAPEFHYIEKYGNYYMTYSTNRGGNGILKSTTGNPEGPYVELTDNEVVGSERFNIDGSFFEDDDGRLYYLWQDGMIAEISLQDAQGNDEVRFLSEPILLGVPASTSPTSQNNPDKYDYEHVGFEGVYLTKIDGKYYLSCAEFNTNSDDLVAADIRYAQDNGLAVPAMDQLTYDCMVAVSDSILGPYDNWHLAVRSGGHNNFFFDREGQLWSTFFGSAGSWDHYTPLDGRPAALKMEVDEQGRLQPVWENGESNLAQREGASASASSEWAANYSAAAAIDGRLNTRWAAKNFGAGECLTVDLGKQCVISGVRTYFELSAQRYSYTIETSADGQSWASYADRSGDAAVSGAPIDRGEGLTEARYVRISPRSHTGSGGFLSSICEFQVYGWEDGITAAQVAGSIRELAAPAQGDTELVLPTLPNGFTASVKSSGDAALIGADGAISLPEYTTSVEVVLTISGADGSADTAPIAVKLPSRQANLAQGKAATASTVFSGDYAASKAVDGDPDTRWAASGNAMPQTLTVDLGGVYAVNGVESEFELSGRYLRYKLETSVDGSAWQPFADRTENTLLADTWVDTAELPAVARYVRMTITEAQLKGVDFASVRELRVFGEEPGEALDVTIEPGVNGTITSNAADGKVYPGGSVTFTFRPDSGYKVGQAYVNGQPVALSASQQYTATDVREALTVRADFVEGGEVKPQGTEPVYNPIAPAVTSEGTADPSVVYHDGNYYYVKMRGSSEIVIYKSPDLFSVAAGECRVVFSTQEATAAGLLPVTLWAPELQYVEKTGKWYIYFTAEESGVSHKMYAMEGGASPDDPFVYRGRMGGQTSDWQIDGVLVEKRNNPDDPSDNQLYFVNSIIQRSDDLGDVQDLGIYEMTDPLNYKEGSLQIISRPTYDWERWGTPDSALSVNEGPEVLYRNGRVFLTYSGSTCWSRHYKLGMLTIDETADFMNPDNWVKSSEPVFTESAENSAYGVGHHCMVYNSDTGVDYIVYHGYDAPPASRAYATNKRDVRMQEFTWNEDGTPNFGVPNDYTTPVGYSALKEFSDSFDSGSFDERWVAYGGQWTVEDGRAVSSDMVLGSKILLKDAMLADFTLEADLTASSIQREGGALLFRATLAYPAPDALCGYYFGLDAGTGRAVLGKFSDGWKVMSTVPFPVKAGQTYHVKVVANGTNIAAYVDDMENPVVIARDSDYRQGSVGVRAYGAVVSADNFSVVSEAFDETRPQTQFEVGGVYKIINYNSGKVVGVADAGTSNGSNIVQQTDTGAPSQQWKVLEGPDGWYKLQNMGSGKLMGVAGSSAYNANVHIWEDDGTAGELWQIDENGDGTFKFIAQCSGRVLDVDGFSKAEGGNISQYTDNVTSNQRFLLVRVSEDEETGYSNPIAMDQEYPDPYIYYHELDGYYYGMATNIAADGSSTKLYLYRSRNMADVFRYGEKKLIAEPTPGRDIWAPEIHYIDGAWYVYYSGGMRGYVLENTSANPMEGAWENKGAIYAEGYQDVEQIDGTILRQNGKLYYIWCLWKLPEKDPSDTTIRQTVVISEMENPWTLTGGITVLSESEYDWEQFGSAGESDIGYKTNEGPAVLQRGGKTFVTYSGSYCHTQYYRLGMLTCDSAADPMDASNWTKSAEPVFQRSAANGLWSTGHNSFTTTPDGEEVYLVYHASLTNQNDDRRYPCLQRISFDEQGTPVFGAPAGRYDLLEKPQSAEPNDFKDNLALGKTASASSEYRGAPGYLASSAVDGDRNTRWAADGSSMPQSLTVDLGGNYFINYVNTVFEMSAPYQFVLEYSDDNLTWKTFADYSANTEELSSKNAEGAAVGRYVRIRFTADGTQGYWASIWEFEVYGGEIPAYEPFVLSGLVYEPVSLPETIELEFDGGVVKQLPIIWEQAAVSFDAAGEYTVNGEIAGIGLPVTANLSIAEKGLADNLALGKQADASSTFNGDYSAAKAVDSDRSTRWAANGPSMPQWLSVDLGDVWCITGVNTVFEMSAQYQYVLETSLDNQEWTTYADRSANTQAMSEALDEGAAFGRYVRIRVLGAQQNWASIWELEVYGGKAVSAEAISLTGRVGEAITLPGWATVRFAGGASRELPVTWTTNPVTYGQPGAYTVFGEIAGSGISVAANLEVTDIDTYTLSGTVDAGALDIPVEGIGVELYRVTGESVSAEPAATTQTDAAGAYRFENVAPGSLVIKVVSTAQYTAPVKEITVTDGDVTVPAIVLQSAVDKTALKDLIEAAGQYEEGAYTAASWAALEAALEEANRVMEDKDATAEEVQTASDELQAAIDGLRYELNTELLEMSIELAEKTLTDFNLTEESEAELQAVIDEAKALLENPKATQTDINEMFEKVIKTLAGIVEAESADKAMLNELIAQAEALNRGNYTPSTLAALDEALEAARAVSADETAEEAEVKAAQEALMQAIIDLKFMAQKDSLKAAYKLAEELTADEKYEEATLAELKGLMEEAAELLEDPEAEQAEVDAMGEKLTIAMAKVRLAQAVSEAKALKAEAYTEASWSAVEAALKAAEEVLENGDAEKAEYEEQAVLLRAAMNALVEADAPKPVKPSKGGSTSQVSDSDYWAEVIEKINGTEKGGRVNAKLDEGANVPATVIDALKNKGVTVVFEIGGKDYAVNGAGELKGYSAAAVYYTSDEVKAMAGTAPAASGNAPAANSNPETGGEVPAAVAPEAVVPAAPVAPEVPAVIEPAAPAEAEAPAARAEAPVEAAEAGMPVWAIAAIVIAATAILGGTALVVIRRKRDNR